MIRIIGKKNSLNEAVAINWVVTNINDFVKTASRHRKAKLYQWTDNYVILGKIHLLAKAVVVEDDQTGIIRGFSFDKVKEVKKSDQKAYPYFRFYIRADDSVHHINLL